MELKPEHLRYLVCPVCHHTLRMATAASAQTVDCMGCGRRYPIQDGLPVLIAERAKPA
jgi:uncharacterized protein YbaR (Trm112 family)